MVFVKVRETYDLHTVQNKMTVIGIHTPKPALIKKNFPGLLMQCRAYRPFSCDVRVACASVLPVDPRGVGLTEDDVAPEDLFNPILYKAMSNKGMSQLEARIQILSGSVTTDVDGNTSAVEVDNFTNQANEFDCYYGILSNAHKWKHANPQQGLQMSGLKPYVYEMNYNFGDQNVQGILSQPEFGLPDADGTAITSQTALKCVIGKAKEMPFINCLGYTGVPPVATDAENFYKTSCGFKDDSVFNAEQSVNWLNVIVGAIIIPPSRLHELYYRMVVEWTLEFTKIRPVGEIVDWGGLADLGRTTHYQNYSYSKFKEAVTGDSSSILDNESAMIDSNVEVTKVM